MSFKEFPEIAPSHVQSSDSQRALEAVFCLPDFIARQQNPDYGKDYDVELCSNKSAINVQFAVQLKSTDVLEVVVVAGSRLIAYQIETSRLNYLSQTPCGSLVVIYEASSKQLFFEWVEEIVQALDKDRAEWRGQETVVIHIPVGNILNQTSGEKIHEDTLALHGRIQEFRSTTALPYLSLAVALHRRIQEFRSADLVISAGKQYPGPAPSIESGKSQDEMLAMLSSKGINLVAGGLHREVIAAYSLIPSVKWGANSLHLLVLAFAYEHSGLPLQSLSYANRALSCKSQPLAAERVAFARQLALMARFNLSQIDSATYYKELEALEKSFPNSEESKGIQLELIFHELIKPRSKSDHIGHVDALVEEARSLVGSDTDWGLRLRLAKIELYAGDQHMMNGRMQIDMATKFGIPMSIDRKVAIAKTVLDLKRSGLARIAKIVEEAEKAKRFDVFAMCYLELALYQFLFMTVTRMLDQTDGKASQSQTDEKAAVGRILNYIDTAAGIFEKLGVRAQHAKALWLKADVLGVTSDKAGAESLLEEARREAESIGLNSESFHLSKTLSDPLNPTDVEDGILNATDDDLRRFAESVRQSISLPESRLENILTDLKSVRLIHQEKRRWCKHLEILQDLTHTKNPQTHYAIDPSRACKCLRYGYETKISHPSAELVIESFKGTYCRGCVGKEI